MSEREVRVYRLMFVKPEGSDVPGWEPAAWADYCERLDWWDFDAETGGAGTPPFRWPVRRHYLSANGAERRAARLRAVGIEASVQQSSPVSWDFS